MIIHLTATPNRFENWCATKASVNLIALKAQRSNQVRHNPDHQAGQLPHRSPHSVSILTAILTARSSFRESSDS
jgi:hypothetical protein